jgi:hypothetical protein
MAQYSYLMDELKDFFNLPTTFDFGSDYTQIPEGSYDMLEMLQIFDYYRESRKQLQRGLTIHGISEKTDNWEFDVVEKYLGITRKMIYDALIKRKSENTTYYNKDFKIFLKNIEEFKANVINLLGLPSDYILFDHKMYGVPLPEPTKIEATFDFDLLKDFCVNSKKFRIHARNLIMQHGDFVTTIGTTFNDDWEYEMLKKNFDIEFNNESDEVVVTDGTIPFQKEIWFITTEGKPNIEPI